tara:strand:+ start:55457 stop:58279 length:2823 start_codon:yes stop_codon:yes gene_type:complete
MKRHLSITLTPATVTLAVMAATCWIIPPASAEPINASISASGAQHAMPAAPISERFAEANTDESPDFQKHVVPLLGRLGCNGRACHGSFQGRGGLQLSLFGYDFKADHEALMDENTGRVDVDDVDESLMLAKPSDADLHEGGKRFDLGSWQHHVLRRWVEDGAKFDPNQIKQLSKLELNPAEVRFTEDGQSVQLTAIAHWEDGTSEDVTQLCRFQSNDDVVAPIDENGRITAGDVGDTHVVVSYDNAVVPVAVLRPIAAQNLADAAPSYAQPIDRLVKQKLDKLGIVASDLCTDEEFVRRISLDITGILPSGEAVRAFLKDGSPDKRTRLINDLLDSPGYAAWWATRFSDWTGNSEEQLNNVLPIRGAASRLWYEWIRKRLDENVPYDEIIEGIVTAESRHDGEDYTEYCEAMTEACKPGNAAQFAERDGMPLFWARRNFQKPEDRAIGFAYTFLGVRIECAQCHKHPFDQWSKNDFEEFAKLFSPIRVNQTQVAADAKKDRDRLLEEITGGKEMKGGELRKAIYSAAKDGKTVPFGELLVNVRKVTDRERKAREAAIKKGRKPRPLNVSSGTILGQDQPTVLDHDPRSPLMDWLRSKDNPYFAKAIVNRIWSNYFGVGIVDPTDDMNLANPPSNAPLLDYLATGLIDHDFDLKWLHREITNSDTYQRSANTNSTNEMDLVNFSHHVPRRLPAEVVYDAVVLATGSDDKASKLRGELNEMAIAEGKPRSRNRGDYALDVFGQSIRETNCDCDRSDSPSLLQSIYLRNDSEMHERLADKNGWVAQACKSIGVAGPTGAPDPRRAAALRSAKSQQKQFITRLVKFKQLPEERQRKSRSQVERDYKRLGGKLDQIGLSMPPLRKLIANPHSWKDLEPKVDDKPATTTLNDLVEEAYLRTLSRFPDPDEADTAIAFIEESETPADGVESLMWALVNTKEFIITH